MSTVTPERKTLNATRFAHSPRCPRPARPRPARLPPWPDFPYRGFRCHGMAARARCLGASGQQGQAAREAPGGRRSPQRSCRSRPEAARLETPSRPRSASRVIGWPRRSWCSAARWAAASRVSSSSSCSGDGRPRYRTGHWCRRPGRGRRRPWLDRHRGGVAMCPDGLAGHAPGDSWRTRHSPGPRACPLVTALPADGRRPGFWGGNCGACR